MPKKTQFKIELSTKQKLIAKKRYLMLDDNHKPKETISDMFKRIAKYFVGIETKVGTSKSKIKELEKNFFEMQAQFKFLSGLPLNDRGRRRFMSDCYVLPLKDSLESIYETLYKSVQLHRLGAGIGYDFSQIRPEGSLVHTTGKEASGPISFMRLYDFSSEIILNRGSARHAGHMGILRIDHPDIEEFISAKEDYTQLTNFNLSVAITDKFMKAYRVGKKFILKHRKNGRTCKKVSARKLLNLIAKCAYISGEPGIIFINEINRKNTIPKVSKIFATNLCGEQPLLPYESCNLGPIVLSKFIKDSKAKTFKKQIDIKELEKIIRLGVRFLDNSIDLAYYPLEESKQVVMKDNRKIGLGIMGWADLLALLDIAYDSNEAINLAQKLMKFIQDISRDESSKLGKEKGNFANFSKSIFPKLGFKSMRNATLTTIAPTGTVSLFADCNGGIEPFFALAYERSNMETLENRKLLYANQILEGKLKKEWIFSKKLMRKIAKAGSIQDIKEIPTKIKKVFKTSYEIKPIWHLRMQAAFQKYTDNAVSKTINVHEKTSIKEIEEIFVKAYDLNLKGVTIYRNKSRDKQVLNLKTT